MRKFTFWLIAALLVFASQSAIQAQTTGSLSGVVADPTGAVVAGATVTIKHNETGDERSVTTNSSGLYNFAQLNPGRYTLTVENAGFKKAQSMDVDVALNLTTQFNVTLEIGSQQETVTVTTGQEVVNTASPNLTNVINTRQVQDLPLSTRNPLELASLQAGIAVIGTNVRGASIGGLRGGNTNVTQDGINAMDNFVKTDSLFAMTAPSLNATGEVSITTGTVGSEAGRGVGQVNVVTKSGTNEFHGGLF